MDRHVHSVKVWVNADNVIDVVQSDLEKHSYTGYKFDRMTPASVGASVESGTVITLYYIKDTTQTREVSYTVKHRVNGVVDKVFDYTDTIWVNDEAKIAIKAGSLDALVYSGYKAKALTGFEVGMVVTSGTVIFIDYEKDVSQTKKVTYTVEHVVDGKLQKSDTYDEFIWVGDPDEIFVKADTLAKQTFVGYRFVKISHNSAADSKVASGTTITLTYEKDETQTKKIQYTVLHKYNDQILAGRTFVKDIWVNDDKIAVDGANVVPGTFVGYKFVSIDPSVKGGDLVDDKTVIILTYDKDLAQTKDITYTVKHVIGNRVVDTMTYTVTVWIGDPDTIVIEAGSLAVNTYEGYKFVSTDTDKHEGDSVENGTVITLSYEADLTQTKPVTYYVHHSVGGKVMHVDVYTDYVWVGADSVIEMKEGTLTPKTYVGYKYVGNDYLTKQRVNTVKGGTIITMFYEKDLTWQKDVYYTVEHVIDGKVEQSATHKQTVWVGEADEIVVNISDLAPKNFAGYRFAYASQSLVDTQKVASGTTVQLFYEKDSFGYVVEYYYDGVKDEALTEKGSALYQSVIDSYTAKNKDGFCLEFVENLPLTISGEADKNVIRVYYSADKNADSVPDKYQKKVIFKVVNGTWADNTSGDIEITVTLTSGGKWDVGGSAKIKAPVGMIAKEGYENGAWDKLIPESVSGTQTEVFTYTFEAIEVDIPLTSDLTSTGAWITAALIALAGATLGKKKLKREEI